MTFRACKKFQLACINYKRINSNSQEQTPLTHAKKLGARSRPSGMIAASKEMTMTRL